MSEFDFSRFGPDGQPKPSPAMPQFFVEAVHMEFLSKQEGRPIYNDQERVKIIIPGDRRAMAVEPVNDEHKARWPKEYAAFKAGLEAPLEGTPLREWPVSAMTASRAEELAYLHIKTVEQLAAVNDAQLNNLGMGARELRERARLWLSVAQQGAAPIERLQSENERLSRENERLTRELTDANLEIRALRASQGNNAHAGA